MAAPAESVYIGYLGPIRFESTGSTVIFPGNVQGERFLGADGTAALPTFSFYGTGDGDNGMYLSAADTLGWSAGGTLRASLSATALTSTVPILAPDGSAANVALGFSGDVDTGFWREGSGGIVFTNNATNSAELRPNDFRFGSGATLSWASGDPTITSADVSLARLAAGSWASTGPNGSATNFRKATTSLSTVGGAGTVTASNLIPAGSLVVGVDARVTTVIAGVGLGSFSIGDGSDADRWGTGIALTAGTTVTLANATINTAPIYAAATSVVLTANAGQFDSGVIRLTVHFLSLTAATS